MLSGINPQGCFMGGERREKREERKEKREERREKREERKTGNWGERVYKKVYSFSIIFFLIFFF
jgi:hypothetical protein